MHDVYCVGVSYYPYVFETKVVRKAVGTFRYTVVFVPPATVAVLPLTGVRNLRVEVDVQGFPIRGALQPARGRWFLMLPKALFKATGVALGDPVEVHLRLDDPNAVEIPDALAEALAHSAKRRKAWDALSVGKQRALAYRVSSAKRAATQEVRVLEIIELLSGGMPAALAYLMQGKR